MEVIRKDMGLIIFLLIIIPIISMVYFVDKANANEKRAGIAAGIVPLDTFVKAVGGEKVDTVIMIPSGYSPANYAPGPQKMMKLSKAQIYFTFSMPAEKSNILPKVKSFNKDIKIIRLDKLVAQKYSPRKFEEGGIDPHLWLSPTRVKYIVKIIETKLSQYDTENSSYYQQRAAKYLAEIEKMEQFIEDKMNKIKGNKVLVYHPVLGYFTDEYGLEMVAIEKGGKKAAPKRMGQLIDLAREENIKAVFHQAAVDSKQTEVIAKEIGAETVQINPLSAQYISTMKEIANLIYKYSK